MNELLSAVQGGAVDSVERLGTRSQRPAGQQPAELKPHQSAVAEPNGNRRVASQLSNGLSASKLSAGELGVSFSQQGPAQGALLQLPAAKPYDEREGASLTSGMPGEYHSDDSNNGKFPQMDAACNSAGSFPIDHRAEKKRLASKRRYLEHKTKLETLQSRTKELKTEQQLLKKQLSTVLQEIQRLQ